MNLVEEALTGHWGPKCSEYEEGCIVCDAWREYENLMTDRKVTNQFIREELSNAPPLDPAIRMAISKLIVEGKIHDLDNKTK